MQDDDRGKFILMTGAFLARDAEFDAGGAGEGMGLGLSISYGIVKGFGGDITGHNRPGGGAEFVILLDAAKPGRKAA